MNLAAIKMMTKVVEKLTKEEADQCLHDLIPKLVKVRIDFQVKGIKPTASPEFPMAR